jgi:hypothetical protein
MKSTKKILLILLLSGISFAGFSQGPPPPPGEDGGGATPDSGNQLGGSAHVGGGVIILLTLALAYGGKRFYQLKKREKLPA